MGMGTSFPRRRWWDRLGVTTVQWSVKEHPGSMNTGYHSSLGRDSAGDGKAWDALGLEREHVRVAQLGSLWK